MESAFLTLTIIEPITKESGIETKKKISLLIRVTLLVINNVGRSKTNENAKVNAISISNFFGNK